MREDDLRPTRASRRARSVRAASGAATRPPSDGRVGLCHCFSCGDMRVDGAGTTPRAPARHVPYPYVVAAVAPRIAPRGLLAASLRRFELRRSIAAGALVVVAVILAQTLGRWVPADGWRRGRGRDPIGQRDGRCRIVATRVALGQPEATIEARPARQRARRRRPRPVRMDSQADAATPTDRRRARRRPSGRRSRRRPRPARRRHRRPPDAHPCTDADARTDAHAGTDTDARPPHTARPTPTCATVPDLIGMTVNSPLRVEGGGLHRIIQPGSGGNNNRTSDAKSDAWCLPPTVDHDDRDRRLVARGSGRARLSPPDRASGPPS